MELPAWGGTRYLSFPKLCKCCELGPEGEIGGKAWRMVLEAVMPGWLLCLSRAYRGVESSQLLH